jgi:hypothetical protein
MHIKNETPGAGHPRDSNSVQSLEGTMYALIVVITVISPASGAVTPVGVTSHIVGNFKNSDECKAAATKPVEGGIISDLSLSRGIYWYCVPSSAQRR